MRERAIHRSSLNKPAGAKAVPPIFRCSPCYRCTLRAGNARVPGPGFAFHATSKDSVNRTRAGKRKFSNWARPGVAGRGNEIDIPSPPSLQPSTATPFFRFLPSFFPVLSLPVLSAFLSFGFLRLASCHPLATLPSREPAFYPRARRATSDL